MIDLTEYSSNELSLQVYNNEALYKIRFSRDLAIKINSMYKYTQAQLQQLTWDLNLDDN